MKSEAAGSLEAQGSTDPAPTIATKTIRAGLDHPIRTPFVATLAVMAAIVLGLAIGSLATILISIVLALFVALGLDPVVKSLQRRGMKRGWGIALVFVVFLVLVGIGIVFLLPAVVSQLVAFTTGVPAALESFGESDWVAGLDPAFAATLTDAIDQLAAFLADPANLRTMAGGLLAFGVDTVSAISSGVIVVVLTLYFLGSLTAMKEALYRLTAAYSRPTVRSMTERITGSIGSFVLGAVILGGCNAVVVTLLHLVLGLPYPALMGVLAFVITLVPVIGSVLFWISAPCSSGSSAPRLHCSPARSPRCCSRSSTWSTCSSSHTSSLPASCREQPPFPASS